MDLGEWILDARARLIANQNIDLQSAPANLQWVHLDGHEDHERLLSASRVRPVNQDGGVLIIGDSINANSRYTIARSVHGATTVEAVDLRDLVLFARNLDIENPVCIESILQFAQSIMTNIGATDLINRLRIIEAGKARTPPTDIETIAIKFLRNPSHHGLVDLLVELNKLGGVRVYRPAVLRACLEALKLCRHAGITFEEAAIRVREKNRMLGRPLPRRAIGSTLLLKGLEAEVSVILNANDLDKKNLYVALTRGAKKVIACSPSHILTPQ